MRQKLNVTIAIELTEGDFTKNVTDFITDLERNARETWGEDAEGGYEGPFIDTMTTTVQVADAATLPMPESDEYNPKVTLSRTTTKTVEQTLVVHALELGLDWGLITQAHALDEHLSAIDGARQTAFELVEDRVFFAPKFADRIAENVLAVQVDESVAIEIKE
jgi:hypothetical protein